MSEPAPELVVDLARLLRKYGPDEFIRVAQLVRSAEFADALAQLLTTFAFVGRAESGRRPERGAKTVENVIENLRQRDPERHALLTDIWRRLQEDPTVTLRDLDSLYRLAAVEPSRSRSRQRAAVGLLRALAEKPTDDVRRIAEALPRRDSRPGGLMGWADIILPEGGHRRS